MTSLTGLLVGAPKNESMVCCPEGLAAVVDDFLVVAADPGLAVDLIIGLGILSGVDVLVCEPGPGDGGVLGRVGVVDGEAKNGFFLGALLSSSSVCEPAGRLLSKKEGTLDVVVVVDLAPAVNVPVVNEPVVEEAGFLKKADSFCCFPENSSKNLAARGWSVVPP